MRSCPSCGAPIERTSCAYCGCVVGGGGETLSEPIAPGSALPPEPPRRAAVLSAAEEAAMARTLASTVAKGTLGLCCCSAFAVVAIVAVCLFGLYALLF